MPRYIFKLIKIALISLLIIILLLVFWPTPNLESAPILQLDFETAKTRIEALRQQDLGKINPDCANSSGSRLGR